ncbi:acyl-CoA dehydrogenase family protein [Kibdelosporangium phytohabitans]|uniref:Acyl-CoA dehydrogenase n=1 Tax=Kibdelosporangium phytohabitans TaxID=860235 RepID=A0A0N9I280_9PSEU|nr:acyl-CoA dehydrogenase family protein [Kibdelosporangium phytohabitans]ALG12709.1 acyl-CoA dehydrogenase [Kibdelosporangium phytohabitans]MBE1464376.1 alkylation response protein AidB-like acyl-CoA dehydrogenase [Kibdelosporangium phytohabitans]
MFVDLTEQQLALRTQLRAYFENLLTPEQRTEMTVDRHGTVYRDLIRRMGSDGWLRDTSDVDRQIFVNEAARADIPLPYVTLQTVGPTLKTFGSAAQKDHFLPRIEAGDVHFAIGYTEPESGTDLASLRTTAVRDGSDYVVNGQKIFTTGAHDADYIWLACRTDPRAQRHKGISILILDTKAPGYSWTPIITCDGAHHVNATYYSDVRVPVDMLVGKENEGWNLITTQLNHERIMLGPAGRLAGFHDRVREWAAERDLLGKPDVRRALAETRAVVEVNELLNGQVASSELDIADASVTKVFSSDRMQRIGRLMEEVVGRHGDPADPGTAELVRWLDTQAKRNLVLTFGGGVNEIQRELIATAGLKLPRVPR